jgi:hypothetical protein
MTIACSGFNSRAVHSIRIFCRQRFYLAAMVIFLALATKALVPDGYMVMPSDSMTLTVGICDGMGGSEKTITIPTKENAPGEQHDPGKSAYGICSFSALSQAASDNPVPPLLLPFAIAYIVKLGLLPVGSTRHAIFRYSYPPSHAPPLFS